MSTAESTICAVWGISPAAYRRLLMSGDLPVPTFMVGGTRVVVWAEALRAVSKRDSKD
ncbi:hypothetical protein [Streptomyces sp.]|uniref:hypothetical protein n=1 Tax=Streptomyces sp. TaxID=1931 RepID=UPI002F417C62